MKRLQNFILIIALIFLAGCKTSAGEQKDIETPVPTSAPIAENTPLPPTQPASQVISISNASYLHTVKNLQYPIPYRLQWSMDGKRFVVGSNDGFRVYDTETLQILNDIQIEQYTLLDFSLASNQFAVTNDWKVINLLDITTGEKIRSISPTEMFTVASLSPDGKTLLTNSVDIFAVDLWDTQTGNFLTRITGFNTAAPVYSLYFAVGGSKLIFVSRAKVQVIDTGSGSLGAEIFHEDFVQSWAITPDAAIIATSAGGTVGSNFLPLIYLWDPISGMPIGSLQNEESISTALAFSPDGTILASTDGTALALWDIATQHQLGKWTAHPESITALTFSPDGTQILTSSSDGTVYLWMVQ